MCDPRVTTRGATWAPRGGRAGQQYLELHGLAGGRGKIYTGRAGPRIFPTSHVAPWKICNRCLCFTNSVTREYWLVRCFQAIGKKLPRSLFLPYISLYRSNYLPNRIKNQNSFGFQIPIFITYFSIINIDDRNARLIIGWSSDVILSSETRELRACPDPGPGPDPTGFGPGHGPEVFFYRVWTRVRA